MITRWISDVPSKIVKLVEAQAVSAGRWPVRQALVSTATTAARGRDDPFHKALSAQAFSLEQDVLAVWLMSRWGSERRRRLYALVTGNKTSCNRAEGTGWVAPGRDTGAGD